MSIRSWLSRALPALSIPRLFGPRFVQTMRRCRRVAVDRIQTCEPCEQRVMLTSFTEVPVDLPAVHDASTAWGDYDNDGDLDVLLTGTANSSPTNTWLYENQGDGTFTNVPTNLPDFYQGSATWGDYDNDGDLDVLLSGLFNDEPTSALFENLGGGSFLEISADLTGATGGDAEWGDYDNDGDLDILLTGDTAPSLGPVVYENRGNGTFAGVAGVTMLGDSSAAWGDYDGDGDLDIAVTGLVSGVFSSSGTTNIYTNAGNGVFSRIPIRYANLQGLHSGSVAWGDYDNDGDLDLLSTGLQSRGTGSPDRKVSPRLYENRGAGRFVDVPTGLPEVGVSTAAWGDYDNDGDLDVLLTGETESGPISKVFENQGGGTFVDAGAGLPGVGIGSASGGDYDNDGDLDVLLNGIDQSGHPITQIWQNDAAIANTPPETPTNPTAATSGVMPDGTRLVTFRWTASIDNETASSALSYNLRVGTTPGGSDVVAPMALASPDGLRTIVRPGPLLGTKWKLEGLTPGQTYYWSLQAVDASLAGSPFTVEQSFKVPVVNSTPLFTQVSALVGLDNGEPAWGDYDNDGDLDLLITGYDHSLSGQTYLYENRGDDTFAYVPMSFPGLEDSSAAWGDYDNDGDLDILLVGQPATLGLYQNQGDGTFVETSAGLSDYPYAGSAAWGDYDNDGDLDILISGARNPQSRYTVIYMNKGDGSFTWMPPYLELGAEYGSATWSDYDNDGDLDILVSGRNDAGQVGTAIYENEGGTFVEAPMEFSNIYGDAAWGDYDNDGDLDLLITNEVVSPTATRLYENRGDGTFEERDAGPVAMGSGKVAWGDYDNDGDLDILTSGRSGSNEDAAGLFENQGDGTFVDSGVDIPAGGSVAWADYDNDGDLDILFMSLYGGTQIWRNNTSTPNTVPDAPTGLATEFTTGPAGAASVTFSWTPPNDNQTPSSGLSYNLRVGTTPGGSEIVAPMAFSSTEGLRKITQRGLVQGTGWTLEGELTPGQTYYWSVQAIDTALAGSPFAAESSFTVAGSPPSEELVSASTLGRQRTGVAGQHAVAAAADGRYVATWWSDQGDGSGDAVMARLYRADGSQVGNEFIVSTTVANDQQNPSVAMRASGDFVIVWQSDSDPGPGVNWEIHGQSYLASGLPDGGEFVVNQTTAGIQRLADVAYLNDGSVVVSWTGAGSDDANGVFARIFDADGVPAGNEFRVNQTISGPQQDPSLTTDVAGGFAVVWHGKGNGDASGVFFRRFDSTGTALTGEVLVNETTSGTQQSASATQSSNGTFIVSWSGAGTGDSTGIFARRLSAAGAVLGSEVLINQTTANAQVSPSVVASADNGFVATWATQISGNDYDISIRQFDSNDTATGDERTVNIETDGRQWDPSLAVRNGNVVAAWSGKGLGDNFGVFTREYLSDLTATTDEVVLSASTVGIQRTASAGQHSIAVADDGRYVTTWWSDRGDGSGSAVFAQLDSADGRRVGGPFVVSTTTANDQQNPSVAMQASGEFTIVWQSDSDPGPGVNWDVHAQRYLASGLPDGGEIVVNTETASNQTQADVAYLNDGSLVVSWTGQGPGDANGVFARLFDPSGTPLGSEFRVNATTTGAQLDPSLTADSAGGFAVVWYGERADHGSDVYFRRFDANGNPLADELLVNDIFTDTPDAVVTQAPNGTFVVVWSGYGANVGRAILAQRLTSTGVISGNDVVVNEFPPNYFYPQISPSVVATTDDGYVVTWARPLSQNDYEIAMRSVDATDTPRSDERAVNVETTGRQWDPSVAIRNGNVIVVWSGRGLEDTFGVFTREFTV